MFKNNSHLKLVWRVMLISLTAVLTAFLTAWMWYVLAVIGALILVSQVVALIRLIDRNNRSIAYLFNAVQNEDFSTRFSENVKVDSEKELHGSLNRMNELLRDALLSSRIQERYFEEILNQANIGILTVNAQGHVLFSNPTALNLFNCTQLNHIKKLQGVDEQLYDVLKGMEPFERRMFKFYNERDMIQLAIKASRIQVKGEQLNLLIVQDIRTELDKQETDSWNRLIRVLTHEIMNSIAPITSISESLLRYFKNGESITPIEDLEQHDLVNTVRGLEVIEEQGKDLVNFVHSYRSFLKVPVPEKKIIRIKPLLERVKVLVQHQADSEGTTIDLRCEEDALEIFADEKLISLVLINICKNGLEAMKGRGAGLLQIQSGTDPERRKYIRIHDNGPGIPLEVLDQIFIPFFSTKEKGTGIGLSLSKQIMQVHEGSLTVRSTVGEGTEFRLLF